MDLVSLISALWDISTFVPIATHVYAHQDDIPYTSMSNLAQLNTQMDLFAKRIALQAIIHTNLTPPTFSSTLGFGTVTCHSIPVSHCLQNTLIHTIAHFNFIHQLSSYFEVTPSELDNGVAWNCLKLSRSTARFGLLKFVSKFLANDIATGKIMARRNRRLHSNCPRCGALNEDNIHVLICPPASTTRSSLLLQLQTWLHSQRTDPSLTSFIITSLQIWFINPTTPSYFHSSDPIIQTAYSSQTTLGWYTFLNGYISKELIQAQSSYYLELGSRKSAARWGANLITQCWNILFHLWEDRNQAPHNTTQIHLLSGFSILKEAVHFEHSTGLSDLPSVYRRYFSIPLPILLTKSPAYLKRWFLVVRSGREALHPDIYQDIWSRDEVLRRWIGLLPISSN